ncbi:hypothetical protein Tco_1420372 [Tanacetum coccineum]
MNLRTVAKASQKEQEDRPRCGSVSRVKGTLRLTGVKVGVGVECSAARNGASRGGDGTNGCWRKLSVVSETMWWIVKDHYNDEALLTVRVICYEEGVEETGGGAIEDETGGGVAVEKIGEDEGVASRIQPGRALERAANEGRVGRGERSVYEGYGEGLLRRMAESGGELRAVGSEMIQRVGRGLEGNRSEGSVLDRSGGMGSVYSDKIGRMEGLCDSAGCRDSEKMVYLRARRDNGTMVLSTEGRAGGRGHDRVVAGAREDIGMRDDQGTAILRELLRGKQVEGGCTNRCNVKRTERALTGGETTGGLESTRSATTGEKTSRGKPGGGWCERQREFKNAGSEDSADDEVIRYGSVHVERERGVLDWVVGGQASTYERKVDG